MLRRRRPETREQSQASYDALFSPLDDGEVRVTERRLVAAFTTRLPADAATTEHYAALELRRMPSSRPSCSREAAATSTNGPFGRYAEAGLQAENSEGVRYRAARAPATR